MSIILSIIWDEVLYTIYKFIIICSCNPCYDRCATGVSLRKFSWRVAYMLCFPHASLGFHNLLRYAVGSKWNDSNSLFDAFPLGLWHYECVVRLCNSGIELDIYFFVRTITYGVIEAKYRYWNFQITELGDRYVATLWEGYVFESIICSQAHSTRKTCLKYTLFDRETCNEGRILPWNSSFYKLASVYMCVLGVSLYDARFVVLRKRRTSYRKYLDAI